MSRTRYFEDFTVGEKWISEPVTITEQEIISYALQNDPQPMHTDPVFAAKGPFGAVIASGFQIAALQMKVFLASGGYGDTPMVGLGIDELRWLKPVKGGDQLVVQREVVETKLSASRPDRGTIRTYVTVRNQDGDVVMSLYAMGRVPVRPQPD